MDRKEKTEFITDYIRFLIETQEGVDELYASICYGGVVYDDTRIDLYELFYKEDLLSQDLVKLAEECSSKIGDIMEYLEERSEDELVRENEEPVCYIQMPTDIWDALYGESDGEIAEYLSDRFNEFIDDHDMDYDLTTYGRNAALIYIKKEDNDQ